MDADFTGGWFGPENGKIRDTFLDPFSTDTPAEQLKSFLVRYYKKIGTELGPIGVLVAAIFSHANLFGTKFDGANLIFADFRNATFDGETSLVEANFSEPTSLTRSIMD